MFLCLTLVDTVGGPSFFHAGPSHDISLVIDLYFCFQNESNHKCLPKLSSNALKDQLMPCLLLLWRGNLHMALPWVVYWTIPLLCIILPPIFLPLFRIPSTSFELQFLTFIVSKGDFYWWDEANSFHFHTSVFNSLICSYFYNPNSILSAPSLCIAHHFKFHLIPVLYHRNP